MRWDETDTVVSLVISERVEKQLKDLTAKSEKKKAEIAELQMQYQQQQPSASK